MTESEWTRKICGEMEKLGAKIFHLSGSGMQSGLPDRLVVHTSWCGLLEFKGVKTPMRTNQGINLADIYRRNKLFAYVVRQPYFIERICLQDNHCTIPHSTFDGTGKGLLDQLVYLSKFGD